MWRYIFYLQSVLVGSAILTGLVGFTIDSEYYIFSLLLLFIIGITNYFISTVLKFGRVSHHPMVNLHWGASTGYLGLVTAFFLLALDTNSNWNFTILASIPWIFPLWLWWILLGMKNKKL